MLPPTPQKSTFFTLWSFRCRLVKRWHVNHVNRMFFGYKDAEGAGQCTCSKRLRDLKQLMYLSFDRR